MTFVSVLFCFCFLRVLASYWWELLYEILGKWSLMYKICFKIIKREMSVGWDERKWAWMTKFGDMYMLSLSYLFCFMYVRNGLQWKCLGNFNWQRNRVHSITVPKLIKGLPWQKPVKQTREKSAVGIEADFIAVLCLALIPLVWQEMFKFACPGFPFFPLGFVRMITL